LQIGNGYKLIGRSYWLLGKLSLAQVNSFSALKIFTELNDTLGLARTNNVIGIVYQLQGDLKNSSLYFEKSIEQYKFLSDLQGLANIYGNLSVNYMNLKDFNKSLNFTYEALKCYRILDERLHKPPDETMGISICFGYIGNIFLEMNKIDSAYYYFKKALLINRKIDHKFGISTILNALTKIKLEEKQFQDALEYSLESLEISKTISNNNLIANSLENIALAYKGLKKYDLALEYYESFKVISDTIHKYDARAISAEFELNSQTDKFELEKQNQEDKQMFVNLIFIIIAIALIILIALIYNRYKIKNKLSQQLNNLNQTKDKLFSIISHDLKSPISGFKNLSKLMLENKDSLSKEDNDKYIKNFADTSDSLLKLLDNLLSWSQIQTGKMKAQAEEIFLNDIIVEQIKVLQNSIENKGIRISCNNLEYYIFADKNMISTIVRNLLANAIKYSKNDDEIQINASLNHSCVILEFRDYGIGISEQDKNKLFKIDNKISRLGTSGEKGTGLGLLLCKDFIEKNNGEIWFERNNPGTAFFITLPKIQD
jgi:signal transduction histidine kinase